LCLVPAFLALSLVSCAAGSAERVARLEETQAHDRQELDLRVSQVEERIGRVENGLNQVREVLAGSAPRKAAAPRQSAPRSSERLPARPVVTGTAPVDDIPSVPDLPYLRRADLMDLSGAAPGPAPAPVAAPAQPAPPAQSAMRPAQDDAQAGPGLEPFTFSPEPKPARRSAAGSSSGRDGGSAAYDAALALYNRGEYDKAQQDFIAFAQKAPGSPLAANALYWLGECQYSLGKYDEAIMTFKDVAAKYPKHAKAAAALLKAGYSYERLGDMDNARFYWQLLLDDFPGSSPAGLARKKMAG
jgi:tol-pal system protein YbgF